MVTHSKHLKGVEQDDPIVHLSLALTVSDTVLQKARVYHIDVCIDILFGSVLSRTQQARPMTLIQPAAQ